MPRPKGTPRYPDCEIEDLRNEELLIAVLFKRLLPGHERCRHFGARRPDPPADLRLLAGRQGPDGPVGGGECAAIALVADAGLLEFRQVARLGSGGQRGGYGRGHGRLIVAGRTRASGCGRFSHDGSLTGL